MDMDAVITSCEELERYLKLTTEERQWFAQQGSSLPLTISRYYVNLIDPSDPLDPLRRQVVPSILELQRSGAEQTDPLAEVAHSVFPRLIHRYTNRVAFLVTDTCATYCRHCFRRRFTARERQSVTDAELNQVGEYLQAHTAVKEILLTGGDPLTLSDSRLAHILRELGKARPDLVIRLCTRMPATLPSRVTLSLVRMLEEARHSALYVMTQFNHPREITKESRRAIALFVDAGMPVLNQTVLLRGVNDNPDVLEELMNTLVANRVKPYYLFQGDLVEGTNHLRVPLKHGLAIEAELRNRLSGLAMPTYAIDLPEGGGKVPLCQSYLEEHNNGEWTFRTLNGELRRYTDPQL
ncbi:MAG: KamA family radical SAM protein [Sphaerochaetaceae bacterium]|nr:KamA family radical SAM protein [Sphaerochaetaceae bacterium]